MSTLSPAKGLGVVVAIVVVVGIYLALAHYFAIAEFWAGFLWLLYWAAIEGSDFKKINASIIGALVGILTGFALHALPVQLADAVQGVNLGLVIALALVLSLIYCSVMGWLELLVNHATMLFLTATTIVHVQEHGAFPGMIAALALAVIFFGSLIWLGTYVGEKMALKKAVTSADQ